MELDESVRRLKSIVNKLSKSDDNSKLSENDNNKPSTSSAPSINMRELCSEKCFKGSDGKELQSKYWTQLEENKVKEAMIIFKKDYCKIADKLGSKSCDEVFDFAKNIELPCWKKRVNEKKTSETKTGQVLKSMYEKRNANGKDLVSFYVGCDHDGPCDEKCCCFSGNNYCEKFCGCSKNCENRFPGCKCTAQCVSNKCPCFIALRECDASVCKCNKDVKKPCKSMNVQLELSKELVVKSSPVAGFGAFAKSQINKDDFIIVKNYGIL